MIFAHFACWRRFGVILAVWMTAGTVFAQTNGLTIRPSDILAKPIQAALSLGSNESAASGRFHHSSDGMASTLSVTRLQANFDLPRSDFEWLAPYQRRWSIGVMEAREIVDLRGTPYGQRERLTTELLSLGTQLFRPWNEHLYSAIGAGLHWGRTRERLDLGSTPGAQAIYEALDGKFINFTVQTLSLTGHVTVGWQQALTRSEGLRTFAEASLLTIYTRTVRVASDDQRFSLTSNGVRAQVGLEWQSSWAIADRRVVVIPSFTRHQYYGGVEPLGASYLNEASVDLLVAPKRNLARLHGLGVSLAYMKNPYYSGWRVELKGLF